jgi:hypothetical protein
MGFVCCFCNKSIDDKKEEHEMVFPRGLSDLPPDRLYCHESCFLNAVDQKVIRNMLEKWIEGRDKK